jgi:hypothetical protein
MPHHDHPLLICSQLIAPVAASNESDTACVRGESDLYVGTLYQITVVHDVCKGLIVHVDDDRIAWLQFP